MNSDHWTSRPLAAVALAVAVTLVSAPAGAQWATQAAADRVAAESGDTPLSRLVKKMEELAGSVADAFDKYGLWDAVEQATDINEQLEEAGRLLDGQTLVFPSDVIDEVREETERLKQLSGEAPRFENPVDARIEEALTSADPKVVEDAIAEVESGLGAYETSLARLEEQRAQAVRIADRALADYYRAHALFRKVQDLNNSAAGVLVNTLTEGRLGRLLYDLALPVQEALSARSAEADRLRREYDDAVAELRANLERFDDLISWLNVLRLQRIVQEGGEASQSRFDTSDTDAHYADVESEIPEADSASARSMSPELLALRAQVESTRAVNSYVKERAQELAEKASQRSVDSGAEFALLARIAAVAVGAVGPPSAPQPEAGPIIIQQNITIYDQIAPIDLDPRPN